MRVNFGLPEKAGILPLKKARYFPRQPHEDAVLMRVSRHFLTVAYFDAVQDYVAHWKRKGFRPGHAPLHLLPREAKEEVRQFVCTQVAHYAFDALQERLEPKPMTPPTFLWADWQPRQDFIVKARFMVQPHVPDPMQMFNLEIPLEDDPLELAYAMMGRAPTDQEEIAASSRQVGTPRNDSWGDPPHDKKQNPAKADVASPVIGEAVPHP